MCELKYLLLRIQEHDEESNVPAVSINRGDRMFIDMDHHIKLITVIYNVRLEILNDYKEYFPPGELIFPQLVKE